jgi:hypothetical protein
MSGSSTCCLRSRASRACASPGGSTAVPCSGKPPAGSPVDAADHALRAAPALELSVAHPSCPRLAAPEAAAVRAGNEPPGLFGIGPRRSLHGIPVSHLTVLAPGRTRAAIDAAGPLRPCAPLLELGSGQGDGQAELAQANRHRRRGQRHDRRHRSQLPAQATRGAAVLGPRARGQPAHRQKRRGALRDRRPTTLRRLTP